MRSTILVLLLASSARATFFGLGCGSCGGGFGGGYGGGYGSSYGGGYGSGYSNYGGGIGSYQSYGLSNMNTPGSYFQPTQNYQTLYAGQPYFTPADSGYSSYGGSYAQSYGQSSPTYTQILPLPTNAQIVNNIPPMSAPQAGGYAQPSYTPQAPRVSSYVQPAPIPVQSPPPPPPPAPMAPPQENSYVQPAAPVRPYESVPHAAVQTSDEEEQVAPTAAPVSVPSSDYDETEDASEQPTVVTTTVTYSQPAAPVYHKEQVAPATNMINSPEEAGYRRVLVKKLKRKLH